MAARKRRTDTEETIMYLMPEAPSLEGWKETWPKKKKGKAESEPATRKKNPLEKAGGKWIAVYELGVPDGEKRGRNPSTKKGQFAFLYME